MTLVSPRNAHIIVHTTTAEINKDAEETPVALDVALR
jgi:hypothetical protein